MQPIFLTGKLSVVDLTPIHPAHEALEFMWRGENRGEDSWPLGRLPLWEKAKAMKIAERINTEASTEAEALAIFEEMS